jgi:hypothetical protein
LIKPNHPKQVQPNEYECKDVEFVEEEWDTEDKINSLNKYTPSSTIFR